jgi:hypothetical protein
MKTKEMDVVHKDNNPHNNHIDNLQPENHCPKQHEWMDEYVSEIDFALQNWGNKNELLLFGTEINEYYDHQKKVLVPHAEGFFTDNGYKELFILHFHVKKIGEKINITREQGFKYPLKILRSRNLITRNIAPVLPFYNVLIGRGIILPFQSHVKGKKRDALPFEDMERIEAIKI